MPKLMFTHLNERIEFALISIFLIGLIHTSVTNYSFGYEYEDTVVYTWYALDPDMKAATNEFRTSVTEKINGELLRHDYPGHFVTYGLFLKLFVFDAFQNRPDLIHKSANITLLFAGIIALCYYGRQSQAVLWLSCMSTQYVVGASLAENLSVTLAIILLTTLKNRNFIISILFLSFLILVKRDCLIYVIPVLFFLIKEKRLGLLIITGVMLTLYYCIVNPLYTEYIESAGLNYSSFSFRSFVQQAPYYLAFALSPLVTPVIFMDFNKDKIFALTFALGLLMYSAHYRSYYVLNGLEQFSEFHSWRYLYNLLPLILFMNIRFSWKKVMLISTVIFLFNGFRLNLVISEEDYMYRRGEYITDEFYIKSELNKLFFSKTSN